jgi:L-amino acid N-acyltransferase YncA
VHAGRGRRTLTGMGKQPRFDRQERGSGRPTLDEVAAARLRWTSPILRAWYDEPALLAQLADAFAPELARVGDHDFGTSYRESVELDIDAEPGDWANRIVELDDGADWALTGIRFRGRDITKPFVDVIACSPGHTPTEILNVAQQVAAVYAAFGPLCVRFEIPDAKEFDDQVAGDPRFGPHTAIDMHFVAGLLHVLKGLPRASTYARVELRHRDPAALAERAETVYAELAELNPTTRSWATPEDVESLAECAQEGLLFEVAIDGQPSGVAAALRDNAHGMTGFVVQEIVLDGAHRGQNFGPGVLQRLTDRLPGDETDVLWGSIHPDNLSSLRNALRVGRQCVGAHAWVTPPGLPGMPR